MAAKKGGLGRGLDSLFADTTGTLNTTPSQLSISEVEPDKEQPRKEFEAAALAELAASIAEHGVLQPIVVRPLASGGYKIIAGERRWRASRQAGLTSIPAIIKEVTEAEAMEMALVENLQREDLGPVEEAQGYKQLMDRCNYTQEQAAVKVGKSRSGVANSLRLLNLAPTALEHLKKGEISTGHAKVLLALENPSLQEQAAELAVKNAFSVRETEQLVKTMQKGRRLPVDSIKPALPSEVELALRNTLGTQVKVVYKNGKGSLQISFYSDDELKTFAKRLGTIL